MKRVTVVYDDSLRPDREIRSITGDKSYGETIFKRITLADRMENVIRKERSVVKVVRLKGRDDIGLLGDASLGSRNAVIHLYSNFGISDEAGFLTLIKKAQFANEAYTAFCDGKPALSIFPDLSSYEEAVTEVLSREFEGSRIDNACFKDLSKKTEFLNFITGGFDARFFNALEGDEYTVTKRSAKKEKIHAEYEFYHLLPDDMKQWFVAPFDYKEDDDGASYTMERYHMTDVAIRFVHGAVSEEELSDLLTKLFHFISTRAKKEVSSSAGKEKADELYIEKVEKRIAELKENGDYEKYDILLRTGTSYDGMQAVLDEYKDLYKKLSAKRGYEELVIGHGDLCFSNILYSREASLIRLIDPKGALNEDELYTDPYYDICKLSHSVCGSYDFFNSGLFEVSYDRDLKLNLTVDSDEEKNKKLFKNFLDKAGFDYGLVRLYEAGLFLSMMPFHMDQPGKVLGFLLNAIRIMEEVKKDAV